MTEYWDRQTDYEESSKDFSAFLNYRNLPPHERSVNAAAAADNGGRSISATRTLYNKWNWKERAEAWDDHQDKLVQMEFEEARKEEAKQMLQLSRTFRDKVAARLALVDPDAIPVGQLAKWAETAAKLSLQATGAAPKDGGKKGQSIEDAIAEELDQLAKNDKATK